MATGNNLSRLSANLTVTGQKQKISNLVTPTEDSDAANKQYVDDAVENVSPGSGNATVLSLSSSEALEDYQIRADAFGREFISYGDRFLIENNNHQPTQTDLTEPYEVLGIDLDMSVGDLDIGQFNRDILLGDL